MDFNAGSQPFSDPIDLLKSNLPLTCHARPRPSRPHLRSVNRCSTSSSVSGRAEPIVTPSPLTSASIVKQEANLLRFPFFALGRRGLQNHKGLLIRGQSKLDEQTYDFEYRITCNSDDLYPGQLARKVHMGLLRIMQSKQAFPFANPAMGAVYLFVDTKVDSCGPA